MEAGNKTSIKSGLAAKGKNIDGKLVDKMNSSKRLTTAKRMETLIWMAIQVVNVLASVIAKISSVQAKRETVVISHYKEPTELEMQKMVNILVSGKAYDEVFNHLDMLHAPLEGMVLILTTYC
ncbi:hypothetical protein Tco_0257024 [Tanacetum coccineum]